ncbi:hypothetical protein [Rhodocyclus tenuis]|uniref:hypothetical protein n=1 Tax=Rhodocyclus tenuis TaxID=1066 RepID=UPI001D18E0F0|nr:hypothetical protein [Rhodocyclus tenuis]
MQNDRENDAAEIDLLTRMKLPSSFAGQSLFIKGEDSYNNAMLGWTHFPWDIYAAGYKDAADALVGALAERKASIDSVVYPLVFLYRQGLELQLKLILPLARRLAGKEAVADLQHSLMPLWSELRQHIEQLDPRENDEELPAIEDFIHQLDSVDPGSFAFRYPMTKKGEVSLPELQHINVRHLSEVMDSVFMLLGGIYSWLGEIEQSDSYY